MFSCFQVINSTRIHLYDVFNFQVIKSTRIHLYDGLLKNLVQLSLIANVKLKKL
jgi:hypothetical protein